MNKTRFLVMLAAVLVLGACVTMPTGPSVMVLPSTGKSFEVFQSGGPCLQELGGSSDRSDSGRRGQPEPHRRSGNRGFDGCGTGCGDRCRLRQRRGRCRNWSRVRSHRRCCSGIRSGLCRRLGRPAAVRQCLSTMHVCEGEPDPGHHARLASKGIDTASAAARILFGISLPAATATRILFGISAYPPPSGVYPPSPVFPR